MTVTPKHVLGAGLLGFVVGAFVVASFQNVIVQHRGVSRQDRVATGPGSDLLTPQPGTVPESPRATATTGHTAPTRQPLPTPAPAPATVSPVPVTAEAKALADRDLTVPVQGIAGDQLVRSFHDERDGTREHEALDILAPRNTPILAVEDGTVAKLFLSKAGGTTIYQFDPSQQFCYYYAHLERYADGLAEGAQVHRGQVLGYVGTSGNAPKNTPHLHFAIFRLNADRHWWEGTPIDPYDVLHK